MRREQSETPKAKAPNRAAEMRHEFDSPCLSGFKLRQEHPENRAGVFLTEPEQALRLRVIGYCAGADQPSNEAVTPLSAMICSMVPSASQPTIRSSRYSAQPVLSSLVAMPYSWGEKRTVSRISTVSSR